ncbi:HAMP domain-containing sensor histidine kinase [Lysinibacillus sp. KU-BSD001]|uniref:HAMP domain-containing sensor histidine kinase n=1 Tax=Lysinibacillus sp. KU-BSD001 TaxID=3141328 RepID=UPI0036E99DDC
MKIKTWLLLTYLLVMILPLVGVYGLYVSINAYYQDKNVEEYFDNWNTINSLKPVLANPMMYEKNANFSEMEALTSNELMVTLYAPNGRIYYSSNPLTTASSIFKDRERVYKHLYELQQNYQTFVYKEPVYEKGQIVGIYEVTSIRTEWTKQVNTKTLIVGIGLLVLLSLLYAVVVYFLNVRLHRPMKALMHQMNAFAKGEPTECLSVKKDELGEVTASFQAMQQEIEETRKKLNEQQRQKEFMIASLSHDLKTPLTSIQAYTESLQSGSLSVQEQQDYLAVISSKSDYMKHLLDDLMMYTLLQSPHYALELVTVEGAEFFEMLLADYEQISQEKGFLARTDLYVDGRYKVNPKQLMRVVDNVVSNAWTYTNDGGFIGIAAFELPHIPPWCEQYVKAQLICEDGVHIIVQNSGDALTVEQCERMFDPLYQVDQARSQMGQRGAGLGLSIAKQIIEKHHGTIQAVSQQNSTAIICWLPGGES